MPNPTPFQYCSKEEAAIATKLVDTLLAKGCTISVSDGEEWTVKTSTNRDGILNALNTTDADTIRARTPNGDKLGDFDLIWGNGCDLLSDHTANDFCEEVFNIVVPE